MNDLSSYSSYAPKTIFGVQHKCNTKGGCGDVQRTLLFGSSTDYTFSLSFGKRSAELDMLYMEKTTRATLKPAMINLDFEPGGPFDILFNAVKKAQKSKIIAKQEYHNVINEAKAIRPSQIETAKTLPTTTTTTSKTTTTTTSTTTKQPNKQSQFLSNRREGIYPIGTLTHSLKRK